MSILSDTAEALKDKLDGLEQDVLNSIRRVFQNFLDEMESEFEILVNQIIGLQAGGKEVTQSQLFRLTRLANSIRQLDNLLDEFNASITSFVVTAQAVAVASSVSDVNSLLEAALSKLPQETLRSIRNFSPSFVSFDERAVVEMTKRLIDEAPLSKILKANNVHAAQDVSETFIKAIIRGINPRIAARQFMERLGLSLWRAETLARTEIVGVYRQANFERYIQSKIVKKWRWSATLDERVCPVCIYLDGKLFDLDDPFATHPNCRCAAIPVTFTFRELGIDVDEYEAEYRESGEEWFSRQSSKFQERILGPAKAKLFSSGQIDLGDLVGEKNHPLYGPVRFEKSIKNLKASGKI